MKRYRQELAVAKSIARKAGVVMKKYFFADNQYVERKKDGSPVTAADVMINALVIKEIKRCFKEGVVGEERSSTGYGLGRKWFCDPIDGTKAFTWGLPTAMFSLALVVDGVPVLGVAYDPFLNFLYWGVRGQGSYMNGKRLRVSRRTLSGGQVAITSSIEKLLREKSQYMKKLLKMNARLTTFSGAVYKSCLIARGRIVGYLEEGVNAYDMAAVQVLVEEAGGKVTGLDGKRLSYTKPFKGAIVSNGIVHAKLADSLK